MANHETLGQILKRQIIRADFRKDDQLPVGGTTYGPSDFLSDGKTSRTFWYIVFLSLFLLEAAIIVALPIAIVSLWPAIQQSFQVWLLIGAALIWLFCLVFAPISFSFLRWMTKNFSKNRV